MGDTTSKAGPAHIEILRVPEMPGSPASILINLHGSNAAGEPASVTAYFDGPTLTERLFPGLLQPVVSGIIEAVRSPVLKHIDKPHSAASLVGIYEMGVCGTGFAEVAKMADCLQQLERNTVNSVCNAILLEADRQLRAQPINATSTLPVRQGPAAAPAESEPGAPPRAEGSVLEDGACSSLVSAGGGDTPVPERVPEHEALSE